MSLFVFYSNSGARHENRRLSEGESLGGRGIAVVNFFCIRFYDVTIAWSDMRYHFAKVAHVLECTIEQAKDHM